MGIKVSNLRRIIRQTLEEEAWVPGRWYPDGEPMDPEEVDLMGRGGLGKEDVGEGEDLAEGVRLMVDNLKRSDLATIRKRYPEFARFLLSKYGPQVLSDASFALASQGFLGGSVPVVAFRNRSLPVVYWDGDMMQTNSSMSLADAIEDIQ